MAESLRSSREKLVRVYAHGVFDLFHTGHVNFLKQAKEKLPDTYLVIGVTEDEDTYKAKGPTVMSGSQRAAIVRACRYVDEVIEDCPPVLLPGWLEENNMDYFAQSDAYIVPLGKEDPYQFVRDAGKFLPIERTDGISTSEIVRKIIVQQDEHKLKLVRSGFPVELHEA